MARIQTELAAKEREALEAIKEDLCEWLGKTLDLKVTAQTFMDALDTGVVLCKLATHIQQSAKSSDESGKKFASKMPMEAINCNSKATHGSFFARDNTSNFIAWCRKLGVEEVVIFESEGLVLHKDEKRVILCLLDVARYADKVGIAPPQLVQMEQEIESLEMQSVASETSQYDDTLGEQDSSLIEREDKEEESEKSETSPPPAKKPRKEEGKGSSPVGREEESGKRRQSSPPTKKPRKDERKRKKRPKIENTIDDKVHVSLSYNVFLLGL